MSDIYDRLTVAALPIDIAVAEARTNFDRVEQMMQAMPQGTDVAVLPELFSTGYIPEKEEALATSRSTGHDTMAFVAEMAAKHGCAVCGSYLAAVGPWLLNRAFFTEPDGETYVYDKHHLFCISEESKVVLAGTEPSPVVRFRGWNISMGVCYDMRFPVWLRNHGLKYDLLLVPANWPERRAHAWTTLLMARAIENQAYVVGANRSGEDKYGVFTGQTYISDYAGNLIGENSGQVVWANLSKSELDKFRRNFPFWKDADHPSDILKNF